ncbi:MAG: tetratricopeptide repeat protein [Candidatus Helarchaeota archaeon]|nr:tetratricopeptide repeat protein [Candidatus Helarchaeota archaeon]
MKLKDVRDSSEKELIQKFKEKFNLKEDDFTINEKGCIIKINSDDPKAHYELGNQLLDKDLLDEAILEFKEAIKYYKKADPKKIKDWHNLAISTWYNMGVAYGLMSNDPKAIECYEKVLTISPDDIKALYNLGGTYSKNRQFDKAIKYLKQVIEQDPNNPEYNLAWFTLGHYYANNGQFNKAIKYLKKALEFDPNNLMINLLIIEIEKELGEEPKDKTQANGNP